MNYRTLLVHLDESPRCDARIDLAARLAREQGAHLIGLAPAGLVNLPARVTPSATGTPSYLELAQAHLDARAEARCEAFRARCAALGVESFEGRCDEQDIVESLVAQGRSCDLLVMSQNDPEAPVDAPDRDLAQQVMMRVGRPVLALPFIGRFEQAGRDVVIAWKDTREATRAVNDALPLLRKARSVHLMCFERPSDTRHVTRLQLNDLRKWLERHGIEAQLHQEAVRSGVGDKLLSRACDLGADLIVMGGYGHSRMAEFVLGGVTRTLLAHMTVPVLLSH